MESMTLGTLSFICGPNPTQGFGITLDPQIQGLDSGDYRIVSYAIPGKDGARVSQAYYDARTITLAGVISGQTPTQYMQNRSLLSQAAAINRDSNGYPVMTKLAFQTMDSNNYFINVQPKKPTFDFGNPYWTKYNLPLLAPDPRIYGAQQVVSGPITIATGGGFVLNVTLNIVFGASSGGTTILTNNGTTDTHPILTFTGPLTNPYITNATTGYAFQLDYTIPSGNTVTIDMYHQTILYNGSANFISYRDPISSWFTVTPGPNDFVLTTANSSDTGSAALSFYPAYNGV